MVDFEREIALKASRPYKLPENYQLALGISVEPEIKKLNIGWAASGFIFNSGRNNYIKTNIASGDLVEIKKIKRSKKDGTSFFVNEIYKVGTEIAIGQLSKDAGKILEHKHVKGLIVNEVVIWSYEDTIDFDKKNPGKNYSANWCNEAKELGYIYLVDFAGFGIPQVEN